METITIIIAILAILISMISFYLNTFLKWTKIDVTYTFDDDNEVIIIRNRGNIEFCVSSIFLDAIILNPLNGISTWTIPISDPLVVKEKSFEVIRLPENMTYRNINVQSILAPFSDGEGNATAKIHLVIKYIDFESRSKAEYIFMGDLRKSSEQNGTLNYHRDDIQFIDPKQIFSEVKYY